MDDTKIRLSPEEMTLVTDAGWILTKNGILDKVAQMLGQLQMQFQESLTGHSGLPAEVMASSPKISKGENYKGLPYRVLDYPRQFDQVDVFAIRTLFWWGRFFSITLHLSGRYKKEYEEKIIASLGLLKDRGFYYCINNDPWQHHFEKDNYMPLSALKDDVPKQLKKSSFVKIAARLDIQEWENSIPVLQGHFNTIIKMLADQLPRR